MTLENIPPVEDQASLNDRINAKAKAIREAENQIIGWVKTLAYNSNNRVIADSARELISHLEAVEAIKI